MTDDRMTLWRLPEGGYMVISETRPLESFASQPLFASTTIDEALGFIRDKLKPQALTPDKRREE
jgi:hypothetical protein